MFGSVKFKKTLGKRLLILNQLIHISALVISVRQSNEYYYY